MKTQSIWTPSSPQFFLVCDGVNIGNECTKIFLFFKNVIRRRSSLKRRQMLVFCCLIAPALDLLAQESDISEPEIPKIEVKYIRDPQHMSYRDAFRSASTFAKYSGPKDLIRLTFAIWPKDRSTTVEGLKARIVSNSVDQELKIEFNYQAVMPMIEKAYEEDAVIEVNRPAGKLNFGNAVTIKTRSDGQYKVSDLALACDQVLAFLQFPSLIYKLKYSSKKCIGASFLFEAADDYGAIKIVSSDGKTIYPQAVVLTHGYQKRYPVDFAKIDRNGTIISRGNLVEISGRFE